MRVIYVARQATSEDNQRVCTQSERQAADDGNDKGRESSECLIGTVAVASSKLKYIVLTRVDVSLDV